MSTPSTETPVRPSADIPNSHVHGEAWVEQLPMQRVHAQESFFFGFSKTVREIWSYRQLLGNLVRKELKIKYKDSALGFLWTLIRPLLQLLIYSIAVGQFLGNSRAIPEFGVYLFTGLLCWTFFTDIIGGCTGSIVGNAGLVNKVYFPRELFPLSVVGAAAVNFLLQCAVLIGAYAVNQQWPHPDNFLLIPLALLVLVAFGLALGLVLAATNVYLRDIQYLVEVGLLFWFWMTPIVYAWTNVAAKLKDHYHWLLTIYLANPMCDVVLAFQKALWPGGRLSVRDGLNPDGTPHYNLGKDHIFNGNLYTRLGLLLAVCLVLVWLAQRIFARAQGNFAQEL